MKQKKFYPAVFISDIHLGFSGANAEALDGFLKEIECDKLYLVGDIFDLWAIKSKTYWSVHCNNVIRRILKMTKNGTRVFYVVGNHDDAIRNFIPLELSGIEVADEFIHETWEGKKLLVIHGDQFDFVSRWLSVVGGHLYDWLIRVNTLVSRVRRLLRFKSNWSFSAMVKRNTKRSLSAIRDFEAMVVNAAKQRECDGVICGHIHTAELKMKDGLLYGNCGDWVESLTAIMETEEGKLVLWRHD